MGRMTEKAERARELATRIADDEVILGRGDAEICEWLQAEGYEWRGQAWVEEDSPYSAGCLR